MQDNSRTRGCPQPLQTGRADIAEPTAPRGSRLACNACVGTSYEAFGQGFRGRIVDGWKAVPKDDCPAAQLLKRYSSEGPPS